MEPFIYQAQSQRVIFGSGTLVRAGDELERLGVRRALVLSTPQQRGSAEALAEALGSSCAGVYAKAAMHTPIEVTADAMVEVSRLAVDGVVSIGGGSTTGLGKAIALRIDLPQLVIPTSYAGSEATPILGETSEGRKITQRSEKVLPEVILYDVDLTLNLPIGMTLTSGFNAIAHATEALYTQERNPVISLLAIEGIRALVGALPRILSSSQNREARGDALYGAWACGTCLGAVGMALHHSICHVLGGMFDLPHSEMHAVILPHAISYNDEVAATLLRPLSELLGTERASQGLYNLAKFLGVPLNLKEIGMPAEGLDRAADEITSNAYWNPRPIERKEIRQLLENAYNGVLAGV